jgi:SAM-dependent methyltransferase
LLDKTTFYSQDLASIHQDGFEEWIRLAGPELLHLFHQQDLHGGTIVDLGCGSGYWLKQIAEAGYKAIGVDLSQSFIEMSRSTNPDAVLIQGSAFEFSFPPSQAVTAIGEVLCYRQNREPQSLKAFFQKVFDILQINGVLVFDLFVQSTEFPLDYKTWRSENDWAVMVEVQEDTANQWLTRTIETFKMTEDHLYRRSHEFHRLQIYETKGILEELEQCGFEATATQAYGSYLLPDRRQAFVAIKSG